MQNYTCTITIGDIAIRFYCPARDWQKLFQRHYRPFLTSSDAPAVEVIIETLNSAFPAAEEAAVARHAGGWEIKRSDFISLSDRTLTKTTARIRNNRYSFDSWLRIFITLRALRDRGLLMHSSGYYHNGCAWLFAGVSGSGKSTITRLLGRERALSDEVVLVNRKKNSVKGVSTPFWGELEKCGNRNFEGGVKGIFFLHHGKELSLTRLDTGTALRKLLRTVLFFSKDARHMQSLLDIAGYIARRVPSCDLSFSLRTKKNEILSLLSRLS